MKRTISILLVFFSLAVTTYAVDFRIEARVHYFQPTEQSFRDIYGGGPQFAGEISVGLLDGLEIWLGGSYFSKKGKSTFTQEEIKIWIVPFGGGLKYWIMIGSFNLYAGLGIQHFQYKETNLLGEGDITEGKIGYVGKLGSIMDLVKGLVLVTSIEYSTCKIEFADFKYDVGGLSFGIGLGFEF